MTGGARAALPEPTAPRLRTPSWRDPRLLFGLLLIAGSVVLGSWAVTAGQRTVGIYQVTHTLTPGTELSAENLAVVQIRSSQVQESYLMAAEAVPKGRVTLRVLDAGEFVPQGAIGTADALAQRPVAIPVGSELSSSVQSGSLVDLWFVPEAERVAQVTAVQKDVTARSTQPYELAKSLVVSEVNGDRGGLIAGKGTAVHGLVPQDALADVLEALSAPGTVSLVPAFGEAQ